MPDISGGGPDLTTENKLYKQKIFELFCWKIPRFFRISSWTFTIYNLAVVYELRPAHYLSWQKSYDFLPAR